MESKEIPYGQCHCGCGGRTKLAPYSSKRAGLIRGEPRKYLSGHQSIRHGLFRHGTSATRTYRVWTAMRDRCRNPKTPCYPRYGGRGIRVCDRWSEYPNFLEDMGEKPDGMSLDRIDNDGDYSKANCRWATNRQQSRNLSTNRMVSYRGELVALSEACERAGLNYSTVNNRIGNLGWSVERALTVPARRKRRQSQEA